MLPHKFRLPVVTEKMAATRCEFPVFPTVSLQADFFPTALEEGPLFLLVLPLNKEALRLRRH